MSVCEWIATLTLNSSRIWIWIRIIAVGLIKSKFDCSTLLQRINLFMTFWLMRFSASVSFMTEAKRHEGTTHITAHHSTSQHFIRSDFSSHKQLEPFTEVVGWVRPSYALLAVNFDRTPSIFGQFKQIVNCFWLLGRHSPRQRHSQEDIGI